MMYEKTDLIDQNKKAKRWFIKWALGFFFVFATVDAFFVYIAVQTHTGEVKSSKGEWAKAKPHFKDQENTPSVIEKK